MKQFVRRRSRWLILAMVCCAFAGCASKKKAVALQEQNRALGQQVLNLQQENEELSHRLTSAIGAQQQAEQLLLEERNLALANMRPRRDGMDGRFGSEFGGLSMADVAQRSPILEYDPLTDAAVVREELLFDSGRAHLRSTTESVLNELAAMVKEHGPALRVVVVGHTDDRAVTKKPGSEIWANNFHLSTARANAVSDYLQAAGVPAQQITVQGQGEHQPIASNASPEERKWNRRVELYLVRADTPMVGLTGGPLRR